MRFCAKYTKNSGFFDLSIEASPPHFRSPTKVEISSKTTPFLEKMQRKRELFKEKTRVLPSKIPFYDINGNNFGDF